jgi:DNA repair protein RadA/Sms
MKRLSIAAPAPAAGGGMHGAPTATALEDVSTEPVARIVLPAEEMNRVLGGGVVPGSVVLIGGEPGIGKSTLLLQASAMLARAAGPVLYVSGEESEAQIKLRARRMGIEDAPVFLLSATDVGAILAEARRLMPRALVVDSIQAVHLDNTDSAPGSVTQVRDCAARLARYAKGNNVPVFLVGHVTKAGDIAGPRMLEHMVDVVLYLEGERFHSHRLLRSVKNRFGSTHEVGVFEMRRDGLVEVANPSEAFLAERLPGVAGSAVTVTVEGTRPLLVEIQALVSPAGGQLPRRTANGIDPARLLLLVAVLTRRLGLRLGDQDIFVNVVGGLRVSEPAVDLAVASAVASSANGVAIASDLVIFGEIGLSGELRSVGHVERRLMESSKLGFARALAPGTALRGVADVPGLQALGARTLSGGLEIALEASGSGPALD